MNSRQRDVDLELPAGMVVGCSELITCLLHDIAATASSGMDILLVGETGTGKELFARVIHQSAPHDRDSFVTFNCASASPDTFNLSEYAGGTIFLDGVDELSQCLQGQLLRFIQEHDTFALRNARPAPRNVRIISASHRDLEARVAAGQFRPDLYYRISALHFRIPPLRERKEDIPAFVSTFIRRAATDYGKAIPGVTPEALALLIEHDWPGNIRELENEIRRAVLLCANAKIIELNHLDTVRQHIERMRSKELGVGDEAASPPATRPLRDTIERIERIEIQRAIQTAGGNQSRAAKLLGITRNGLALKLKRLSLSHLPSRTKT